MEPTRPASDWVRPVLLDRQKERKGSPRKNLNRKLAEKIAVALDPPPLLRGKILLESWLERSRLGLHETVFPPANVSGNFQQKMRRAQNTIGFERLGRSARHVRELAVEAHQKH